MQTTSLSRRAAAAAVLAVLALASAVGAAEQSENRWEPRIKAFEDRDRTEPPAKGGILFVGSSSIVGWDLAKCFPNLPAINRGFGGSQIADSIHFAARIVLPYEPKVVVFYAGDNDIASGKTPEQVAADYARFVEKIHGALPKARIVFVAIKPSVARWKLAEKMRQANALIREAAEKDPRLVFVDIDTPMIGDDGLPRAELLKADGLHLNDAGYELWSTLVLPHLTP